MNGAAVEGPLPSGQGKVIVLSPRRRGALVHIISQEEKLEAVKLARAIGQAKRAYRKQMEFLEQAFRSGAVDEPGEYMIEDFTYRGGGSFVEKWSTPGIRVKRARAQKRKRMVS